MHAHVDETHQMMVGVKDMTVLGLVRNLTIFQEKSQMDVSSDSIVLDELTILQ
jgi:hypothetical protein